MSQCLFRHGCLLIVLGVGWPALAGDTHHVVVQSRVFDIEYQVNDQALPLDSVGLWYTQDEGQTWHHHGYDDDRQSPLTFHAPAEGAFGFYLVLTNAAGVSGQSPTSGSQPHQRAFVDYTPPVLQLHPLRQATMLAQRVLQVRWTAIDANLTARPIEISYRRPPTQQWTSVLSDPLTNTGRYDWRLPEDTDGSLAIRITVIDRGNHRVQSNEQVIEITSVNPPEIASPTRSTISDHAIAPGRSAAIGPGSTQAGTRASGLYAEALGFRDRGDYRATITRLREAVRLDPQMTDAFAEMAEALYSLGDLDRAQGAYDIALAQRPTMRRALQGSARVHRQKYDYDSAAGQLRTILRYNPNDAEVWMNLGDIAIYQGDEILARDCYTRASEIDPEQLEVIDAARKRLTLMQEVSRSYRPEGR